MFYKLISFEAYNFSTKISIANLPCNQRVNDGYLLILIDVN